MATDKRMIAARANTAIEETRFYKSYIRNACLADEREVSNLWEGAECAIWETDWFFTYKGKDYRVNQDRSQSFLGEFTLVEL